MKTLIFIFASLTLQFSSYSQLNCQFAKLSNDTSFQDYFEYIDYDSISQEIIVIGTKQLRKNGGNIKYGVPFFQKYDNCGNIILTKEYPKIEDLTVWNHERLQTNRSHIFEPIAKRVIQDSKENYCLILRVSDSLNNLNIIAVGLDKKGDITNKVILQLTNEEISNYWIRGITLLEDNNILVVFENQLINSYLFYYMDASYSFLAKKIQELNTQITEVEEIGKDSYVCAQYGLDLRQYKVICIDSSGLKIWEYDPYPNKYGAVRQIMVTKNKIILIGYVDEKDLFTPEIGLLTELDLKGNFIKEIKIQYSNGKLRPNSVLVDNDGNYLLAGYQSNPDSSGYDIAIYKVDSTSKILWDTAYNFKSQLGTLAGREYNDYGGFKLINGQNGSLITIGVNEYRSVSPLDGTRHHDAIIIKTRPGLLTNTEIYSHSISDNLFYIKQNPVNSEIDLVGNKNNLKLIRIFDLNAKVITELETLINPIKTDQLYTGMYILQLVDINNKFFNIRFVKI